MTKFATIIMALIITHSYLLLISIVLFSSCGHTDMRTIAKSKTKASPAFVQTNQQIADYIRNIFQDKNGNLWFGTNGYGVAHYNGDSISYLSVAQGFDGHQITGITEDLDKNIWFATDMGVVKYDLSDNVEGGKRIINYTNILLFEGRRFWSIHADNKGHIWAGSSTGIYRFDGISWEPFELPLDDEATGNFITKATTWSIIEDKAGNMWFSTNGYGAFKYDGNSFTQYAEEDGLTDNSVDQILEDSKGNIWFGTRFGGISRYDGENFVNYTHNDSIGNNEVCSIYETRNGDIWFSSEGFGVYRYSQTAPPLVRESFTNFGQNEGLEVRAVQTIFEDKKGQLWVGGGGGLYRYDPSAEQATDESFVNIRKNGPWE